MKKEALRLVNVHHVAQDVTALSDIQLTVFEGEWHGVLVRNDRTRACMTDILCGRLQPDSGMIFVSEEKTPISDSRHAKRLGIQYIGTQTALIPNLCVAENLFLTDDAYYRLGFTNRKFMRAIAKDILLEAKLAHIHPDMLISELTELDMLLVGIVKAAYQKPRVLIIDNIFNHYTIKWIDAVYTLLRRVCKDCAILFFSNRFNSFFSYADTVTVIRQRATAATLQGKNLTRDQLAKYQSTSIYQPYHMEKQPSSGKEVLTLSHVFIDGQHSSNGFALMEREILGIVDEDGFINKELTLLLAGRGAAQMRCMIKGRPATIAVPRDADEHHITVIDAEECELFPELNLYKNMTLTMHYPGYNKMGLENKQVQKYVTREALGELHFGEIYERLSTLAYLPTQSKNKQFIIRLAKAICSGVQIIVLRNPHLFFDDLSIRQLPRLLDDLRRNGISVLIISVDPDLAQYFSDRTLWYRSNRFYSS